MVSMGGGAMSFPPMPPPMPANTSKKAVTFAPSTKRAAADFEFTQFQPPQKKPKDVAVPADDVESLTSSLGEDDRLSDVISEDLESVDDGPEDGGGDDGSNITISTVGARGRGRGGGGRGRGGRGGGGGGVKNVITL